MLYGAHIDALISPLGFPQLMGIKQQQQASRERSAPEAQPGSIHRAFLADGREVILAELGGAWVRLAKEEFETEVSHRQTQFCAASMYGPWSKSSIQCFCAWRDWGVTVRLSRHRNALLKRLSKRTADG